MVERDSREQAEIDRPSAIVAGAFLTAIASLPFNLMPLILGSAAEHLGLDDARVGIFGGSYMAGACAATIVSPLWIRRVSWVRAVGVGTAIGIPGLLLASVASGFAPTMAALFLAGCGLATSYAPGLACIGDTSQPDRNFGILFLAQIGLAAAVGAALPAVDELRGFSGIMALLAVISLGNLACARWLPARGAKRGVATSGFGPIASNLRVVFGLSAHFVFYVSVTAVWAFLELIGNHAGISDARVGVAISSSLLIGGLGALGAALIGERIRPATGIASGSLGLMLAVLALLRVESFGSYLAPVLLLQIAWSFGVAYQLGLIASLDLSGRFTVLATAFATTGAVVGPALGGALATGTGDYSGPIVLSVAAAGLSLLIYLWCAARRPLVSDAPTRERTEGISGDGERG